MPLSEHEQRQLDQIERALYAEDPKFASTVRSSDLKTHRLRQVRRAVALLVVGLITLVVGVAVPIVAVGVAGFVIMLGAGLVIARSIAGMSGRDTAAAATRIRRPRKQPADPDSERGGLLGRFEERWKRRWEDRER